MRYLYSEQRRILLIDENVRKRNLRAMVLRNHEVEVHTASTLGEAMTAWKTIPYDLVLLAAPENSAEAAAATARIWQSNPRQRVGLLVGPPTYVRELDRPAKGRERIGERLRQAAAPEYGAAPQWQEIVQQVVTGWCADQGAGFGVGKLTDRMPAATGAAR